MIDCPSCGAQIPIVETGKGFGLHCSVCGLRGAGPTVPEAIGNLVTRSILEINVNQPRPQRAKEPARGGAGQ